MVEQFVGGFLFDRWFYAVGCPQRIDQFFQLGGINRIAGNVQGGLRLPRQRGAFPRQAQDIIAGDGFALVGDAQVVTAIGGRCNGQGAWDCELDVLTTVGCGDDIRQDDHVDGALGELAPDRVGQVGRDALFCHRQVLPIFDAEQQTTTRCVREGDAVLGQFVPVGCLADHRPQGLLVEQLPLLAHISLFPQSKMIRNSVVLTIGTNKPFER